MNNSLFFNDKEILLVSCYDILMKLSKLSELSKEYIAEMPSRFVHDSGKFIYLLPVTGHEPFFCHFLQQTGSRCQNIISNWKNALGKRLLFINLFDKFNFWSTRTLFHKKEPYVLSSHTQLNPSLIKTRLKRLLILSSRDYKKRS